MPTTLGDVLRRHRLAAGTSQEELARLAGMSVRALRDLEQDRVRQPRARSLRGLAQALSLSEADHAALLAMVSESGSTRPWLGVLGPLVVHSGARTVDIGSPMRRALLGLLALHPRQVVPNQDIIDALWGEDPPKSCLSLVHTYVGQLRQLLEPERGAWSRSGLVRRQRGGYLLDLGGGQVDAAHFDELAGQGLGAAARGDTPSARDLLGRALDIWRGPVLADGSARLRAHPTVVALHRRRLTTALAFADIANGEGRYAEAAAQLRPLLSDEPLHEGLHARLMLALAGCGEQAAALQLFAAIRGRLSDELGIEPGLDLHDAYVRVLRQQLPMVMPIAAPLPTAPAQLPADVAAFTGRGAHLGQLDQLLPAGTGSTAVAIALIAGTAGVGKTALAVHWAHRVRDGFPDGQLYVNLRGYAAGAPMRPIEALARFLRALGVPAEQVPLDVEEAASTYRSLLAGRRMLVLLDNAHDAEQVRPLLPGSGGCLVLVTSRDQLAGLVAHEGARRLTLDVLTPAEAERLFGRLLGDDRVAREADAAAELAGLCAYLPLALRIAAANLSGGPHQQIAGYAAELRSGNLLHALTVDGDRQVAVRAALDLSYAVLPPEARRTFRLLGLVPGPDITEEAASALTATPPEETRRLLDRLVGAHLIDKTAPGRYAYHDLLRFYAAEQSRAEDPDAERCAAVRRLYDHYLHRVDAAARLLYPGKLRLPLPADWVPGADFTEEEQALGWLEAERPSLLAAIRQAAADGPRSAAWLLADALRGYFHLRMHAVDWLAAGETGLAAAEAEEDLSAQGSAHLSLGLLHWRQGRYRAALDHHNQALSLMERVGWVAGTCATLCNLGAVFAELGRLREAVAHIGRAVEVNRANGRRSGEAVTLGNLGLVYCYMGRLSDALSHSQRALELYRQIGNRNGVAVTLANIGEISHELGYHREAQARLSEALGMFRDVGDRAGEAEALRCVAVIHRDTGQPRQALGIAHNALVLAREVGRRRIEAEVLNTLGSVHERLGQYREAVEHHHRALRLARETGERYPQAVALVGLAVAHGSAGEYQPAVAYGSQALTQCRSTEYRVLEGRALAALAEAYVGLGQPAEAARYAQQALVIQEETGHQRGVVDARRILKRAA